MVTIKDINKKLYSINHQLDAVSRDNEKVKAKVNYVKSRLGSIQGLVYEGIVNLEENISELEYSAKERGIEIPNNNNYEHNNYTSNGIYGMSNEDMLPPPPQNNPHTSENKNRYNRIPEERISKKNKIKEYPNKRKPKFPGKDDETSINNVDLEEDMSFEGLGDMGEDIELEEIEDDDMNLDGFDDMDDDLDSLDI